MPTIWELTQATWFFWVKYKVVKLLLRIHRDETLTLLSCVLVTLHKVYKYPFRSRTNVHYSVRFQEMPLMAMRWHCLGCISSPPASSQSLSWGRAILERWPPFITDLMNSLRKKEGWGFDSQARGSGPFTWAWELVLSWDLRLHLNINFRVAS